MSVLCGSTSLEVKFVIRYLGVSHRRCAVICWCTINMLPYQTSGILGVIPISYHDTVVRVSTFERKILRKMHGPKESGE